MLKTLQNAFKVKDVRHRIFYVLMMLVVIRIGSQLPVPGVDGSYFKTWFESQTGDAFNFLDAFTGGSFSQMSIFALSITPYITSSIIIQLLTIAIPKLEEMQRDGEDGRKKLGAITRYVTIGLSLFESIAMAIGFGNRGLIPDNNFVKIIVVVVALTAGSAFLMWVGEQINEKGVGNGISIVLLINIVSRIPSDMTTLYESFMKGKIIAKALLSGVIIAAIIIGVVILVIILNGAERRIPVQYSKKMQGRKMMGGQSSHIPLKVNTAGVIPVIFASSIMSFPSVIASFLGKTGGTGIGGKILAGVIGVIFHLNDMKVNDIATSFKNGAKDLIGAALVVAMAQGIMQVLGGSDPTTPTVINTIMYGISKALAGLSGAAAAVLMYVFQSVFNFFVVSGSGQAAITMPIMAPLADLLGVSRQTSVLAFQLGDAFTNLIVPTSGCLIGSLAIARIEWSRWIKFMWKFLGVLMIGAVITILIAVGIGF